jgi:hypothetical protein
MASPIRPLVARLCGDRRDSAMADWDRCDGQKLAWAESVLHGLSPGSRRAGSVGQRGENAAGPSSARSRGLHRLSGQSHWLGLSR